MKPFDPIKLWFGSVQECGEYIGIRFGRIAPGSSQPEWFFLPHSEVDGIGGFADLLRRRGAELPRLPHIKHTAPPSRLAVLRTLPKFAQPQRRLKWMPLGGSQGTSSNTEPPTAVAWHCFGETTTTRIRRACRKSGFTVNSFLLKHLNKAIRPYLDDQSAIVPWLIPVNLRGKVKQESDVENHSSYITVKIKPYDSIRTIHSKIYSAIERGDHWANWYSYESARVLSGAMRRYLIRIEKYFAEWHIGGFSNLGDWDPEKKITNPDAMGDWLFAPPVLRCQHLGVGCVTFQNRLSLLIQAHPQLTTSPNVAKEWMEGWVKEIQMDLDSLLPTASGSSAG